MTVQRWAIYRMNENSRKKAIFRFLILQAIAAIVLLIAEGKLQLHSAYVYAYIGVFFIELYAFSKLEDAFITLPESIYKYQQIYENGIDANASIVGIESTDDSSEFGSTYIFTLSINEPPTVFTIEKELMGKQVHDMRQLTTLPIRYLPNTKEAIILSELL